MLSRPSNCEPAYLDSILFASTIVVIVESEINIDFERAMIFLTEGRSSSSESDISTSEGSAVQPDERDWLAAGRPRSRRSCIKPGVSTGERLKRVARPNAAESEEAVDLDN